MKRKIASILLAGSLIFGLSACGNSDESLKDNKGGKTTTSTTPYKNEKLKLSKDVKNPTIVFPKTAPPKGLKVQLVEAGKGRTVAATDYVIASYVGQVWGKDTPFDSSYKRGMPAGFSLEKVIKGWTDGLSGLKVGAKVFLTVPADLGYGPSGGNANAGIGPKDVISFYVELVDVYGKGQAGDAKAKLEADLATLPVEITGELGKPVTIKVKATATKPTKSNVTVIAKGSGKPVAGDGTNVIIQYSMSSWDNSSSESSYDTAGPQPVVMGQYELFDLLKGIPVGSRVLITNKAANSGDDATAMPYAVVIDILGQLAGVKPAKPTK